MLLEMSDRHGSRGITSFSIRRSHNQMGNGVSQNHGGVAGGPQHCWKMCVWCYWTVQWQPLANGMSDGRGLSKKQTENDWHCARLMLHGAGKLNFSHLALRLSKNQRLSSLQHLCGEPMHHLPQHSGVCLLTSFCISSAWWWIFSLSAQPWIIEWLMLEEALYLDLLNLVRFLCTHFLSLSRSLDGVLSFCCVNCTIQLGVISKLPEGALNPVIYVIDEDIKGNMSVPALPWGTGLTASKRPAKIPPFAGHWAGSTFVTSSCLYQHWLPSTASGTGG